MALAAEEAGFDSLWVGDHLLFRDPGLAPRGPWEAWSVLAALAAVTERVSIGPLVASASFHNPALLAKKAATVDEISGGRLILGLGAGWNEAEYAAFGFPFDHRVARFEEALAIITGLLRGGEVDFVGRYHQARGCVLVPKPARPGGPPITIGTTGPRMLRLAARHADAWNSWFTWFGNRPEGLRELKGRVDEACRTEGRDPLSLERTVAVLVQFGEGQVALRGGPQETAPPLRGSSEELARALLAFRAEGINALNHPQFLAPNTTPSSTAFGQVTAEWSSPRTIQFALKILF